MNLCLVYSSFTLQSIEFFLAKEVTHFVTDKHNDRDNRVLNTASPLSQSTPATPQTPQTPQHQSIASNLFRGDLNDITASPNGSPYDARVSYAKYIYIDNYQIGKLFNSSVLRTAIVVHKKHLHYKYVILFVSGVCFFSFIHFSVGHLFKT